MALKYITNFTKDNNHTNIILLRVPHRHNLMESSCVNKEIRSFNRKLTKYVKTFNHTTVFEMNREFFTPYGLHSNGLGKQTISNQTVSQICTLLEKKAEIPISLDWKMI
jgi:hypothetical protein